MPKFYTKTFSLTLIFGILILARLSLLRVEVPSFLIPWIDILIPTTFVAIVINEKLTRREKWNWWHIITLFLFFVLFYYIRMNTLKF